MPTVDAKIVVPVSVETAFWVSQTTAPVRYQWDTFIRSQRLLNNAVSPGKGVRTETISRHGLRMVSQYVSFQPPTNVGMKMLEGPWFFGHFGGGWRFTPGDDPGTTLASWRYNFAIRPAFLAPIANPIGTWLLGRDIRRRIVGFARGCQDETVLTAAHEIRERWLANGK